MRTPFGFLIPLLAMIVACVTLISQSPPQAHADASHPALVAQMVSPSIDAAPTIDASPPGFSITMIDCKFAMSSENTSPEEIAKVRNDLAMAGSGFDGYTGAKIQRSVEYPIPV